MIIPLTEPGTSGDLDRLAEGVTGYAIYDEPTDRLYIPVIFADNPGSGDVGRFLDSLPDNAVFPTVMSAKLAGMLTRRGYREISEHDPEWGEVKIWIKNPDPE